MAPTISAPRSASRSTGAAAASAWPSERLPVPFGAPTFGRLAKVVHGHLPFPLWPIEWNRDNPILGKYKQALLIKFDSSPWDSLAPVPILYQQIGSDAVARIRDYYLKTQPAAHSFVFAGPGSCGLTDDTRAYVTSLSGRDDLAFIRSGHVDQLWCKQLHKGFEGSFGIGSLSPQHAKILVQLVQDAIEHGASLGPAVDAQKTFRAKLQAFLTQWVVYPVAGS